VRELCDLLIARYAAAFFVDQLGPVDPHSVQNDGKLSSDGNLGFAQSASQAGCPML
jgi:hypothetical protein